MLFSKEDMARTVARVNSALERQKKLQGPKNYTEADLQVGVVLVAPNQGQNITPYAIEVRIEYVADGHVHYSTPNNPVVKFTTITRFLEIVNQPLKGQKIVKL